ncbi:MAG: ABC transporter ATP-binding protein [Chlorobiales bacterium]|jgi:sulfonate transport system ATP-binding protein|nr:ABC transporter ATP-binding protein [Chlorobiales bacterium]
MSTEKGALEIRNLSKRFVVDKNPLQVLNDINITIPHGDFISIIGCSGCGKTTLLRIVLGLETNYEGDALMDGERIEGPGTNRGIVFQDHRLLPWLTVGENVAFGLDGKDRKEKKLLVDEHLKLVGLSGFESAYPSQLSGGMAQRAAIARALANKPEILLLDEPLGSLDALTRMHMQKELERLWLLEKITMIMVTHDVEEAVYLSDKVVIMSSRPGIIKKIVDVPLARPRDRSSYDFIQLKEEILKEFHLGVEHPFVYAI